MNESNHQTDEGVGSVLAGRVVDFAKGLILKPRPIVVLYKPTATDDIVSFKVKRGIVRHSLIRDDVTIRRSSNVTDLLELLLHEVSKLTRQGYIEL